MRDENGFHKVKVDRCVCVLLLLCVSANCISSELASDSRVNMTENANTLHCLDISKPSISQPIESGTDRVEWAKFVQVEVAEVLNPKKYAVTFDVHYQTKNKEKINLGSFSLYPADNPGTFIVPTQGRVKNDGSITLTMVIIDKTDSADHVKVCVKKLKLL